jgi:hypothetical protein
MTAYYCAVSEDCDWDTGDIMDDDAAVSAMVWHVFNKHPNEWKESMGTDEPPIDPRWN